MSKDVEEARQALAQLQEELRREINLRQKAEAELHDREDQLRGYQQHLETLVAQRTVELQRTKEALEAQVAMRAQIQRLLERIVEAAPTALFWKDLDSRYVGCNSAVARGMGLASASDVVGRTDFELPWAAHAEELRAEDRQVIESGQPLQGRERALTIGTGPPVWFQVNKVPLMGLEGQIIGVLGCYEDISERKAHERRLIAQMDLARGLLDATSPEEAARLCLETTLQLSGMDCGGVYVLEKGGGLRLICHQGVSDELVRLVPSIAAESPMTEALLRSELPGLYSVESLPDTARMLMCQEGMHWVGHKTVHHRGQVIGAICTASHGSSEPSVRGNLPALNAVAAMMGSALVRFQAEKALGESQRFLQTILDSIPMGVFWKDRDSRYLGGNRAVARDAALASPTDLVGQTDDELPWAQDAAFFQAGDRRVMESGQPLLDIERRVPNAEGHLVWMRTNKVPLRNAEGQIIGVLGYHEDVSARKEGEQRLLAQMELARGLLEVSSLEEGARLCLRAALQFSGMDCGGVYTLEENGDLRLVCHHGMPEEVLPAVGVIKAESESARDAVEATLPRSYSIDDISEARRNVWRRMGIRYMVLVPVRHHGRVIGALNLTSRSDEELPSRDGHTALEAVAAMMGSALVRFQAEQVARQSEQSLRESEARYRVLFEAATDGMVIVDVASQRFLWANPAFCDMFGCSLEAIEAMGVADVHPPEELTEVYDSFARFAEGRTSVAHEVSCLRKDGSSFLANISGAPMVLDGRQCLLGIFRDITEYKRDQEERHALEAQLFRTQRLESLGVLAGGIAHDFNNILAGIQGFTELTHTRLQNDSRAQRDLGQVLRATERAKDLVRQILTFSRHVEQSRRPVELSLLLTETLKFLRASLPSTIRIDLDISPDGIVVQADPTHMHQVFVNLCTNAQYAMQAHGGTLTVGLEAVEFSEVEAQALALGAAGSYAHIWVRDTGSGIPAAIRDRIFDPFFTTKPQGEGTGMGLATTHGIISGYGGTIRVESEVGVGTLFHIYLPALDEGAAEERPAESALAGGTERILFVDDETSITLFVQEMLESLGYRGTTRNESLEALRIFAEDPEAFDLVITDLTMPGLAGPELVAHLRQIRPQVPVILMTGFPGFADGRSLEALGNPLLLQKPCTAQELSDAVRRALDSRS